MNKYNCRICGYLSDEKHWGGVECPECRSVSVITLPTTEELNVYYTDFNDKYLGGTKDGGNLQKYANRYLDLVKLYSPGGSLIDIGSSTSPFPNLSLHNKFDVAIIDYIKPKNLDSRIKYINANLDSISSIPVNLYGTYDIVTCWAVIEHVRDPLTACHIISKLLRPGGLAFLTTPEVGTVLTNNSIGRSPWFFPPEHLNLISPKGMNILFDNFNMKLIDNGRFELSGIRFIARYGVGFFEAIFGKLIKYIFPQYWNDSRDKRLQLFKGISYMVYKK